MDRRLYIHIYGERIRRRIKQTREKHGEINTEEAEKRKGGGRTKMERNKDREREGRRGVETERKLLEVSGNWR